MLADYFTLLAAAQDLHQVLRGSILSACFTQEKQRLVLHFRSPASDDAAGPQERWLLVSCEPSSNFVLLRRSFSRARRNTLDVLTTAAGQRVTTVRMHPSDREIVMDLERGQQLLIRMFRSSANVLLVDAQGIVVDAFLHPKKTIGNPATSTDRPASPMPRSEEEFRRRLADRTQEDLKTALRTTYPYLGPVVLHELSFRAGISLSQNAGQLSPEGVSSLHRTLRDLLVDLRDRPSPRLYRTEDGNIRFALIPLQSLTVFPYESFPSVQEATRAFIARSAKDRTFLQEKKRLLDSVERSARQTETALARSALDERMLAKAAAYETSATLLMEHLPALSRGITTVTLTDRRSHPPVDVVIRLDARRTPAQNAEQFFQKAKQARESLADMEQRRTHLKARIELLGKLLRQLNNAESTADLNELRTAHPDVLRQGTETGGGTGRAASHPFRVFRVSGGFEVWAGKSSKDNDVLTMKHARPNDLWFHARGSSGSHVILRVGTGKGEPGKKAMEEAASIAAYYSKMKHAKHVPVAMTLRKYVRKPKGSPPGTVAIEREKLLFVEPRLLSGGEARGA